MPDNTFPDFFGDSVNVSAGPYGVTLTFYQSDPTSADPTPGSIVGRVRIAPELIDALLPILQDVQKQHLETLSKKVSGAS